MRTIKIITVVLAGLMENALKSTSSDGAWRCGGFGAEGGVVRCFSKQRRFFLAGIDIDVANVQNVLYNF